MANAAMRGGWRTSRWRAAMWGAVGAVLLAPAVAMRFTDEVAWGAGDFAFAGLLLIGGAVLFEVAARKLRKPVHLAAAGGLLSLVVALIWAEAAVGIF
jgi:peptidoglycan/LPS O-acetylase OafA/YrhL